MPRQKASELSRLEQPMILDQLRRTLHQDAALEGIGSALAEIRGALELFDAAVDRASSDPHLSVAGQRAAVEQAARDALRQLDVWTAQHAEPVQQQAEREGQAWLHPAPPPTSDVEKLRSELRHQALLRGFEGLSLVERNMLFVSAEGERAEAMMRAPPVIGRAGPEAAARLEPFVSPEFVETRRRRDASARDPAKAATVEDLQQIARVYQSSASSARTAVEQVVGYLPPEPTEPAPSGG